jgi:Uncharacterized protein conserved in bacteria (DUF2188)
MLGRHVYRVHSTGKSWEVRKEGEATPLAIFRERQEAIAEAFRLAGSDQPAKVTIDNGDGTISQEHLIGAQEAHDF